MSSSTQVNKSHQISDVNDTASCGDTLDERGYIIYVHQLPIILRYKMLVWSGPSLLSPSRIKGTIESQVAEQKIGYTPDTS